MLRQSLRADLLMLLTAAIWGSTFVAQRLGMEEIGPFLYTGLRFALGALVLLPLLLHRPAGRAPLPPPDRPLLLGGALLGLVLTCGINLQQVGLLFTSVTNSGFITGLYVIMVPPLGLLVGQRAGTGTGLGAGLAVLGMALLSLGCGLPHRLRRLAAATGRRGGRGVHVLLVGALAGRHDPLRIAFLQFSPAHC